MSRLVPAKIPPIVLCVESELKDLIPDYAEIVDALRRKDFENVRLIGHMAASSEAYGFARLTRLGRALEQAAAHAADEIGRQVDDLRRYLRSLEVVYPAPAGPLRHIR